MSAPKVCVLRAPGTNCDAETAFAFEVCGAEAERVHLFRILEEPKRLRSYQVLCIPGGFSYGDDIGAGVIFSSQLRGHLAEAVGEFLAADTLVLGICNGFQVLLKAGVLPGGRADWPPNPDASPPATLTWNDSGKYTALWIRLRTVSTRNVFLNGIDEIDLPIAHAEGRLQVREPSILDDWMRNGQVAVCYQHRDDGSTSQQDAVNAEATASTPRLDPTPIAYPDNPNGSVANIAGLSDPTGRVLGLMPHPERFIHRTQHPLWTRRDSSAEGDGLKLFRNAVDYFRKL